MALAVKPIKGHIKSFLEAPVPGNLHYNTGRSMAGLRQQLCCPLFFRDVTEILTTVQGPWVCGEQMRLWPLRGFHSTEDVEKSMDSEAKLPGFESGP